MDERTTLAKDIFCAFLQSPDMMSFATKQRDVVPLQYLVDEAVASADVLLARLGKAAE